MKFVFLSGISWTSCLGGRTVQLAKTAAVQHEVHFVTIPGLRTWNTGLKKHGNLTVHTLPPKSNLFPQYARWYLKHKIRLHDAVVIVSNPAWASIIKDLKAEKIIYDQLDYVAIHAPGKKNIESIIQKENFLMQKADLITTVSERLLTASQYPEKTCFLPNAVPDSLLKHRIEMPSDKVIGFHGALYEWIDYQLLEEIADTFPDHTLKLTGPVRNPRSLATLRTRKNVKIQPAFDFDMLPEIINGFTIGIIPFKDDEVSRCSNPLKMYEYLAMGKCVVSTVSSVVFGPPFRHTGRKNFCAGIAECLENLPSAETCRRAASEHTWQKRFDALCKLCRDKR